MCRSIQILYNKKQNFAKELSKKLQSKIVDPNLKVELVKTNNQLQDRQLDNNLVTIKVEKYLTKSSSN